MGDAETVKLPLWAVGIIIGLLGSALAGAVYIVETHSLAVEAAKRLDRIENGIDQLWSRQMERQ